jgi:hypothetical protein
MPGSVPASPQESKTTRLKRLNKDKTVAIGASHNNLVGEISSEARLLYIQQQLKLTKILDRHHQTAIMG